MRSSAFSRFPFLLSVLATGLFLAGTALAQGHLGLDVSHHSGEVDWRQIETEGYTFVYLKASEGVDDPDPLFRQHWKALAEGDLLRGAYHFYVTEDDPEAQAKLFLSQVVDLEPGDLPPVVDVEVLGHGTTGNLSQKLQRFLDIVEQELGVTPVIYTSAKFWNEHFEPSFGRYPLWVAEYEVDEPNVPHGWDTWHVWQFQGDAEIPGVEKGADRSRLHSEVELDSLLVGARRGEP